MKQIRINHPFNSITGRFLSLVYHSITVISHLLCQFHQVQNIVKVGNLSPLQPLRWKYNNKMKVKIIAIYWQGNKAYTKAQNSPVLLWLGFYFCHWECNLHFLLGSCKKMIKNNKITDKETLTVKQGQKLSLWMTTGLVCFEVSRSKEITSEVLDPITTIL